MTPQILLDSGAFTAARQGDVIDLREYIQFVRRNSRLLSHAINLDIIPDSGMDRDQIESACVQSHTNHQTMKDTGLSPLPVVHQLDAPHWLERYLEEREPYIALAPKGPDSFNWLSQCFRTIKLSSYQPKVRGLAVTNTEQLVDLPWTSVDSATWVKQAAVGHILVPLFDGDDQPLFHFRPDGVFVTDRMTVEPNHIDRLNEYKLADLRRFIGEHCKLNLADIRYDNRARCLALIRYLQGVEAASRVRLFFVSSVGAQARNQLIECGAHDHLLSYAAIRRQRDGALEKYIEGTVQPVKVRKKIKADWSSDAYRRDRAMALVRRAQGVMTKGVLCSMPHPIAVYSYIDGVRVWFKLPLTSDELHFLRHECRDVNPSERHAKLRRHPWPFKWDKRYVERLHLYQPTHEALSWLANRTDVHLNYAEISLGWIFDDETAKETAEQFVWRTIVKKHHGNQGIR